MLQFGRRVSKTYANVCLLQLLIATALSLRPLSPGRPAPPSSPPSSCPSSGPWLLPLSSLGPPRGLLLRAGPDFAEGSVFGRSDEKRQISRVDYPLLGFTRAVRAFHKISATVEKRELFQARLR